ncbi:hypothetical protein BLA29_013885 [Euroglyphus maynei]|uniref:Uncharacterized protein n=1 Tax=Euroglyphus maynei TaxID=6958 RepID=A0A1Y3B868_EURMA|nr:hypothetical protein BLA29_013885 [Euroglyphus maynei]
MKSNVVLVVVNVQVNDNNDNVMMNRANRAPHRLIVMVNENGKMALTILRIQFNQLSSSML